MGATWEAAAFTSAGTGCSQHFQTVRVAATSQQLGGSFTNPLGTLTALEASVIEEKRIALIPAEHLQDATEGLGRALRLLGQQIQALAPSDIG